MEKPGNMLPARKRTIWWRGIRERCPRCGDGELFKSYLRQNDRCPACGEDFSALRADDGPAWLTILLIGFIVVPVAVWFAMDDVMPQWMELAALLALTVAATFFILPRTKGWFISVLWLLAKREAAGTKSRYSHFD